MSLVMQKNADMSFHSGVCLYVSFHIFIGRLPYLVMNTSFPRVCLDYFSIYINAGQHTGVFSYTGWRRLIGCLKLQVILRKRATDYRALLQKMTYEDKASYDSTPPYTTCSSNLILPYMFIICLSPCIYRSLFNIYQRRATHRSLFIYNMFVNLDLAIYVYDMSLFMYVDEDVFPNVFKRRVRSTVTFRKHVPVHHLFSYVCWYVSFHMYL